VEPREFLKAILYTREEVDDWFTGKAFTRSKYDSELGYLFRSGHYRDGIDGSFSSYDFDGDGSGPRRTIMHAERPCRINTYGDSFTQCAQVNDGETWQEALAAHLCEPVRNFGVGSWSVYQAYLRMKREERRTPAEYIILNIYDAPTGDHYRNLVSWQRILAGPNNNFHIFPTQPYVKANPAREEFIECKNPCPTPDSFYNLCDLDRVYENFKDDLVLRVMVARANAKEKTAEKSYDDVASLARAHGIEVKVNSPEALVNTVELILDKAAIFATMCIVEEVEEFAVAHGKKVLYVLSYGKDRIANMIRGGRRFDQEFVDFLQRKRLPYVDLMEAHLADFSHFKITVEDYLKRYFTVHYNPLGNFFAAFAMKNTLVNMLDPKPISYRSRV